jgi:uncharacterized MAPEG superfamily protein
VPHEIKLLACAVALALLQLALAVVGANLQNHVSVLVGNRESPIELSGWAGRAGRAARNMMETFPLFAALVLAGQAAGRLDAATSLGADLYIWARTAYAVIYVAGIPWLRTLAWFVSMIGIVLILAQVL